MTIQLKKVYPWGRSYDEYAAMFALSAVDVNKTILGCGDGPASFNATLSQRGGNVISLDPLYRFTEQEIADRIAESYDIVVSRMMQTLDEFVWTTMPSPEHIAKVRKETMSLFLSDYTRGKEEGRYVCGALPEMPFTDSEFGLALCSYLLFYYIGQFDADFHLRSLREMCRVAEEVRVFPLVEVGSVKSRYLDAVTETLAAEGYQVSVEKVDYEVLKGGNEMLRVRQHRNT